MGLRLRLDRHRLVEDVEVDEVFPSGSDAVFHTSKNPHVKRLGHVGGVGDEHNHRHVVQPQELHERLHRVALEPVKDEDGSVVVVAQPFTEPGASRFYFGEQNVTKPLPKNIIVDEAVLGVADFESVGREASFGEHRRADGHRLRDDGVPRS